MNFPRTGVAAAALVTYIIGGLGIFGGFVLMVLRETAIAGGAPDRGLALLVIALGLGLSSAAVVLMRVCRKW